MESLSSVFSGAVTPEKVFGEGNGNPLQYSCLENPTDRGNWWATVHGVTESQTRLSDFHFHFSFPAPGTQYMEQALSDHVLNEQTLEPVC